MPRLVWLILAVCLFLTGTYLLGNVTLAVVVGGYPVDYAMAGVVTACFFYYGTYRAYSSWKKARVSE